MIKDSNKHQSSQSQHSLRGSKVRLGVHSVCSGLREEKMTGFHAHHHTSLLTRLRTHRLPRLIPAQHPETEPRLLPAQVDLDVLVVCC